MTALPRESRGFALFAEILRVGLLVALCGAAVVTVVPAIAAGASHLRRFLRGDTDSARAFFADFASAMRELWQLGLGAAVAGLLMAVNAVALASGGVPGAAPVGLVTVLVAMAGAVVCLRAASVWRSDGRRGTRSDGRPASPDALTVLRTAADRSYRDLAGSALIVVALGMGVVLVWMLAALAVVVPGLLVLALLAVEQRTSGSQDD